MGLSVSWAAVRGVDKPTALKRLGLVEAGPNARLKRGVPVLASQGDWLIFVWDGDQAVRPEVLRPLSDEAETIGLFVEEHVMFSQAVSYRDGAMTWSVTHDCEQGDGHLGIEGEPPSVLAPIHERLQAEQRKHDESGDEYSVDYIFDVPADLADALTAYRFERDQLEPTLLARTGGDAKSEGGFFARLFGGR